MYVYEDTTSELSRWIRDEVEFEHELSNGNRGVAVKRVQEWLNLHGFGVVIDSNFGPVTAQALERFQDHMGMEPTGIVDEETFIQLVQPMCSVIEKQLRASESPQTTILTYAEAHLNQLPCEVGGRNRGPWVRLYMQGNEGTQWAWCAGFVVFLLHQTMESLNIAMPIRGSFSCDTLVAQAKDKGLFLSERDAWDVESLDGSIFMVRRTSTDWTHTGVVIATQEVGFDTIEGNTNDDGEREGYEVCSRSRGYADKDFVLIS